MSPEPSLPARTAPPLHLPAPALGGARGMRAELASGGRGLHAAGALALGLVLASGAGAMGFHGLAEGWVVAALMAGVGLCTALGLGLGFMQAGGGAGTRVARAWARRIIGPVLFVGGVLLGLAWWSVRIERAPGDRLDVLLARAVAEAELHGDEGVPLAVRMVLSEDARVDREPAGWTGRRVWARPLATARGRVAQVRVSAGAGGEVWTTARGVVTLLVPAEVAFERGAVRGLHAGDAVEVVGWYRPPRAPMGPEELDTRSLMAQAGRAGSLRVEGGSAVEVAGPGAPWLGAMDAARARVAQGLAIVRRGAVEVLDRTVPGGADDRAAADGAADEAWARGPAAAMLRAMLLGESDAELSEASGVLAPLGLVHVLSISGFHLALVAWVVLALVRLTGDRGSWEWVIAAGAVVGYLLVVPGEAPVLRSGLMLLALLAGEAMGRRHNRLSTLGFAAFALLLWRPADVLTPGFQLSFLTTGVLLWRGAWASGQLMSVLGAGGLLGMPGVRGRGTGAWARGRKWWQRGWVGRSIGLVVERVFEWTVTLVACAMLASVCSAPLVMVHAGLAPGWGVLAGVALSPLAGLALVLGVLGVLVGLLAGVLDGVLGGVGAEFGGLDVVARWMGELGVWVCERVVVWAKALSDLPGCGVAVGPVPLWWGLVATLLVVALLWCASARGRRLLGLASFVGVLMLAGWLVVRRGSEGVLEAGVLMRVQGLSLSGSDGAVVRGGVAGGGEEVQLVVDPGSSVYRGGPRVARWVGIATGPGPVELVLTGASARHIGHVGEVLRAREVRWAWVSRDVLDLAQQRPLGEQARVVHALARAGVPVVELATDGPTRIGPFDVMVPRSGAARVRLAGEEFGAAPWVGLASEEGRGRAWRVDVLSEGGARAWVWVDGVWVPR